MDSRDLLLMLLSFGVLGVIGAIAYALDDLHMREVAGKKDDLDRELEELIGGDK